MLVVASSDLICRGNCQPGNAGVNVIWGTDLVRLCTFFSEQVPENPGRIQTSCGPLGVYHMKFWQKRGLDSCRVKLSLVKQQ